MSAKSPAARRKFTPPLRVELVGDTKKKTARFLGYGSDLSETGVFVQTLAARPAGTKLRVLVHLRDAPSGAFASEVEVCWRRGYGGKYKPSAGMGLRFVGLGSAERATLHSVCTPPAKRR